jgi:hypothetical protein
VALSSISTIANSQHELGDCLMPYLWRHGQHVSSLDVGTAWLRCILHQLPPQLQLKSLQLRGLRLQLQPGGGCEGVLGPARQGLTQLQLEHCLMVWRA